MIRVRLKRLGRKKRPFYRVVVTDKRTRRDGAPITELGFYDPIRKQIKLNKAEYEAWLKKGASPTPTVVRLFTFATDNAEEVVNLPQRVKVVEVEEMVPEAVPAAKAVESRVEEPVTPEKAEALDEATEEVLEPVAAD